MHEHAAALLVCALVAVVGCGGEPAGDEPSAANLVVISLDTTRADRLSCYGAERETTPRLDALARDGHRFAEAFTVMPTTLPSHAAMFTSLHPAQLGVRKNGDVVPESARTLAERLKDEGFATGAFVSAAPLFGAANLDQGFDAYVQPSRAQAPATETRNEAARWIEARRGERFFCFVHLFDPHTWYEPPEPHRSLFAVPDGPHPPAREFVDRAFTEDEVTAARAAYDAEIHYADAEVGALLDALERAGLRERTIVAVVSDHGETLDEMLASHGYGFDHGEFLFRRELRVPLLLWLPEAFEARGPAVHDAMVSTLDLMPTLLELLGAPASHEDTTLEGRSLVPLLRGETLPARAIVAERHAPRDAAAPEHPLVRGEEFSVLFEGWHFLRADGRDDLLFDMAADPAERTNVLASHAELARKLQQRLDAWRRHVAGTRLGADPGEPAAADDALLDDLRQLGYTR